MTNLMNRVRNLTLLRTDDHYTRTTVLQVSMQPPYPVPAPLCVISMSEWLQLACMCVGHRYAKPLDQIDYDTALPKFEHAKRKEVIE